MQGDKKMNELLIKSKDTSNLLIIYQIVIYISMLSGYRGIAYYISLAFIGLFVVRIITRRGGSIPTNKSWNNFMLFLVFYAITSLIKLNKANLIVYLMYYTILFFPILITEYLKTESTTETMIKSLKYFMYIFIIFCLISIGYYLSNPGLARDMAAHLTEGRLAIGGGYSLAYAAAVICVYIFSKMLNNRINKSLRYILICVVCFWLVYLTESSITFFAMFIGMTISIVAKGRETSKSTVNDFYKFCFIGILIITLISVIIYNKYSVAEWILNFTNGKDDHILYSRIEEIVNKMVYGKTNFHVDHRGNTLEKSIEVFKRYPIFGIGYKYGHVFKLGKQFGIGNHSEILDSFARYGIVGGYLWLAPYFRTLKLIFKKNIGCAITILIMMYYNPFASFHSNAVMFLFIPLFEEVLNRKEEMIRTTICEVK